jgi:hypothetical protein
MNARRILMALTVSSIGLAYSPSASAHRLDEYLQATRLSIDIDRVTLEVDLTPGVSVAPQLIAWIDTNRDGQISAVERAAYAEEMIASITVSVDGRPTPLTLLDGRFPDVHDMSLGVGTIRLLAIAKLSLAASGRHQLSCVNTHRPEASVYLVNALVPANRRIQIVGQRRDAAQHGLTVDYEVLPDAAWTQSSSLLAALAAIAVLAIARRPS